MPAHLVHYRKHIPLGFSDQTKFGIFDVAYGERDHAAAQYTPSSVAHPVVASEGIPGLRILKRECDSFLVKSD